MTFHPVFGNHRERYAFDCSTITYLNEGLPNSSVAYMLLVFERCGFFNLPFFLSFCFYLSVHVFLILCINGDFNTNLSYVYGSNTHVQCSPMFAISLLNKFKFT